MLNEQTVLYFLTLDSSCDIEEELLSDGITIKKILPKDWVDWVGAEIDRDGDGLFMGATKVGKGTHSGFPPPISDRSDPLGFKIFDNNYVLFGSQENEYNTISRIDKGIRMFSSSKSGVSYGFSNSSLSYIHPAAGWAQLSPSKINKSDLLQLEMVTKLVNDNVDAKGTLLLDRYRNATQGMRDMKPHNRFIDLVTILEMLFVPDGASGEIGYKLRMRAAAALYSEMGQDKAATIARIKDLYNKRSKLVHEGKDDAIQPNDWIELVEYCRKGILKFLKDPARFTAMQLDKELIGT